MDADGLRAQLGIGNIVPPLVPGATGEIFNLQMEEVAEGWPLR